MSKKSVIAGGVITFIYLAGGAFLLRGRLAELLTAELNNIGDFLAGAFSPLAFLWLVLGFLQQGRELKASSDALLLQSKELANSVQQQKDLVAIAKAELESKAAEYRRLSINAQPIFVTSYSGVSNNNGIYLVEYRLTNFGPEITHVEFRGDLSKFINQNIKKPTLRTDEFIRFLTTALNAKDLNRYHFIVAYVDRLGEAKETHFHLYANQDPSGPKNLVEQVDGRLPKA